MPYDIANTATLLILRLNFTYTPQNEAPCNVRIVLFMAVVVVV